jgi:hypothetical protein
VVFGAESGYRSAICMIGSFPDYSPGDYKSAGFAASINCWEVVSACCYFYFRSDPGSYLLIQPKPLIMKTYRFMALLFLPAMLISSCSSPYPALGDLRLLSQSLGDISLVGVLFIF